MRIVFYSRPWTYDMHHALEERWAAAGAGHEVRYITQHFQVVHELRKLGRDAVFVPAGVQHVDVGDPLAALEAFERRHAGKLLPLGRYLMSERFFLERPGPWQIDQLARYALFFERFFEDFRPELLIHGGLDVMPNWLANDLAYAMGCEPLAITTAQLPPGRLAIERHHDEIANAEELYRGMLDRALTKEEETAARRLQSTILGTGTQLEVPPRRDYRDFMRRLLRGSVLADHLRHTAWQVRERINDNYFVDPNQFLYRARQPFRVARERVADSPLITQPPSSIRRPYVFFPLHMEPEQALLVHGSYFENQVDVIRNIARSLPAGHELVVKEHPYMAGARPLRYYRRLSHIPFVRLVPAQMKSNTLIQNARVIATIASTVGLEAALIGRPVVLFGEVPWQYAPTVHQVGALCDLPELLRLAATDDAGPDRHDVLAFGVSWDAAVPPGRHHKWRGYDWLEPANVAKVSDAIDRVIGSLASGAAPIGSSA